MVIEGEVAFCNLTEHEVYNGKSTGRYSIVITLDDAAAAKLEDLGVNVKTYEDKKQRKFASKFNVDILDTEDRPIQYEVPYGSRVRLLWQPGNEHPVHGTPTYVDKVRVLEMAERSAGVDPEDEEF